MKHVARKRFGQHFLSDAFVLGAIVDLIDPQPGQTLVEIGPGLGALTWPLLERCQHADRHRARPRPGRASAPARRRLERDRGRCAEGGLQRAGATAWASRCGWWATCPTTFPRRSCSTCWMPPRAVADQHFMLQKEVVAAHGRRRPGGKDYGRLSVMLQWRYRIDIVLEVPPQAFEPPPRVDSAIVRMRPLPQAGSAAEVAGRAGDGGLLAASQAAAPHARALAGRAQLRRQLRPAAPRRGSAGGSVRRSGRTGGHGRLTRLRCGAGSCRAAT